MFGNVLQGSAEFLPLLWMDTDDPPVQLGCCRAERAHGDLPPLRERLAQLQLPQPASGFSPFPHVAVDGFTIQGHGAIIPRSEGAAQPKSPESRLCAIDIFSENKDLNTHLAAR